MRVQPVESNNNNQNISFKNNEGSQKTIPQTLEINAFPPINAVHIKINREPEKDTFEKLPTENGQE